MSDIQRMATELLGEEDTWFVVPEKKERSTPHSDKPHRFPSSITGRQARKARVRRKMEKQSRMKNR